MNRPEIKKAMGTWLQQLAPWDVFSTWTFSRPVSVAGAMHWARRHVTSLEGQRNGWVYGVRLADDPRPCGRLYGFIVAEEGRRGGLIHLHALLGNVGALKPSCGSRLRPKQWGKTCCMRHSWPCGYARVFSYDPKLGAAHYLSKYIVKSLGEWSLFGDLIQPQKTLDS